MNLSELVFPYAWLAPFICFFTGYYIADRLFATASFTCPSLVGMPLPEALTLGNTHDLNIRVIQTVIDDQKPAHTILNQKPAAGEHIKAKQTIFCTLSIHRATQQAPDYVGQKKDAIITDLKKNNLKAHFHPIAHTSLTDLCIGQTPAAGVTLHKNTIDLYISAPKPVMLLMPSLIGLPLQEAKNILSQQNLAPMLVHDVAVTSAHSCSNCIVTAQCPAPGTVINLAQAPNIQLLVHENEY